MTGSLFVKNSGGLAIGVGDSKYPTIKIDGVTTVFENPTRRIQILILEYV